MTSVVTKSSDVGLSASRNAIILIAFSPRMSILRGGGKAYQDILVVKGRDRIAEFYEKMTSNKKEILCISAPHDAKFFDATIKKAAAAFMANGTKLKILTSVDRESLASAKDLLVLGDVRHADSAAGMNILLADDEVLVSPATFQTKNQNAIWSNVRDYVDHYRTIFDNLWASSHSVSGRMEALEQQIRIDELKAEMSGRLKKIGFKVQNKIEGVSKMAHEFAIVATRKDESIVVDVMGPSNDIQGAIINFVVKCIDVPAKHKLLVALSDLEAIETSQATTLLAA
jgi:hypothetical protein